MANYDLRIETQWMKKALDVLSTVISRKSALPVLADACIRYDHEHKLFTIMATNTEQWVKLECWRPDEHGDDGRRMWLFNDSHNRGDDRNQPLQSFCINVALYREAFSMLPAMPVICLLTLNDDGTGSLKVTHSKGEFTLPVNTDGRAEDFPVAVPVVTKDGQEQREGVSPLVRFRMESQRLLPMVADARVCTASDELRPMMNAVCLDCFHDHLVVVASDGHSLSKQVTDTGMGWLTYGEFAATDSAKVLIPSTAMSALMKAFAADEALTVTADTRSVRIEGCNATLTTCVPEGVFPNYESVIPKDNHHRVVADRLELMTTLRRIAMFSEEASNMVILRREGERIILRAADEALGRAANEYVAIINADSTLPDGFQTGCKISTLSRLLDIVNTDNIVFDFGQPDRAVLLREDAQLSAKTLLMMPMLVQ